MKKIESPWQTTIFASDSDHKEQIKKIGEYSRILEKVGFWKWTPEAQTYLSLSQIKLIGKIFSFIYLKCLSPEKTKP